VGRTYIFECPHCLYRTQVSGGADAGLHCAVQTVVCRDCRELFDVLTRIRRRAGAPPKPAKFPGFERQEIPPVILRETPAPAKRFKLAPKPAPLIWQDLPLACPAWPKHFVEPWQDPGRCPRCGSFMEKNGLPFRLWD